MFLLVKNAILWAWTWICEAIHSLTAPLVQSLNVPSFDFDFSFITSSMWGMINEWVPVTYVFVLTGIYVGLAVSVYTVNWILGLIPTVS